MKERFHRESYEFLRILKKIGLRLKKSIKMASSLIRGMATNAAESAIKHVTVIGGGLMGSGIAQVSENGIPICINVEPGTKYVMSMTRKVHSPTLNNNAERKLIAKITSIHNLGGSNSWIQCDHR